MPLHGLVARDPGFRRRRRGQALDPTGQVVGEARGEGVADLDAVVGPGVVPDGPLVVPGDRQVGDQLLGALHDRHGGVPRAVHEERRLAHPLVVRLGVDVDVVDAPEGKTRPEGAGDHAVEGRGDAHVAEVGVRGERPLLAGRDDGRRHEHHEDRARVLGGHDRRDVGPLRLGVEAHALDARQCPGKLHGALVVGRHAHVAAAGGGVGVHPLVGHQRDHARRGELLRLQGEALVGGGSGTVEEDDGRAVAVWHRPADGPGRSRRRRTRARSRAARC